MGSIDLRSDTVWEAVRSNLWTQLETPLGLKSCEQGNYLFLPTGEDLTAICPLVAIEWLAGEGHALPGFQAIEVDHLLNIHYLQVLSDSEILTREISQGLGQIANIFAQPPFEGPESLPGYTVSANGINVFSRSAPSMRILDTFLELELPIGHGVVELRVKLHHYYS